MSDRGTPFDRIAGSGDWPEPVIPTLATVTPTGMHQDYPQDGNVQCDCGGEWWFTSVVVDAATGKVTGHGVTLKCASCDEERPWMATGTETRDV